MSDRGSFNGLAYFRGMRQVSFFSLEYQHRQIQQELSAAFAEVMSGGHFILGDYLNYFEKEFANFQGSKYCVGTGNGHDALLISLKTLKISARDEVIVPSHTCQATWLAVLNSGARPVPVEIDESFTIDPSKIESVVTTRTKAIIPVHLYGQPCKMDLILALAKKHNLFVIEDNAQAHGAKFKGKITGSFGHINATSFYPTKNLGTLGDGGAITTNDESLYHLAKAIGNYGSVKKDEHLVQGINSRLDELQAAFLSVKLKKLGEWTEIRRQNADIYFEQLKNVGDIILPPSSTEDSNPVFHQFVIRTLQRDKLKEFLEKQGIGTAIHYPTPVHLQKAYSNLGFSKGSFPIAEKLSDTALSLPIWPGLKTEEFECVCNKVRDFFF